MSSYNAYTAVNSRYVFQIPYHWKFEKIAQIFIERKEKNNPIRTENILSLTNTQGVIPYSEKGNVGNKAKEDLTGYNLAYPGDIVLNSMNVIIGSVGLSSYFGAVSPVYYMLYEREKRKYNIRYFEYVFRDRKFQGSLQGLGNGILEIRMRIPMSKLKYVALPVPPRPEQDQIVRYLDWQVSKINRLIAAKKRQIELVREKLTNQISQLVWNGATTGSPQKASRIQGIATIPAHWNEIQNKRLFSERVELSEAGEETLLSVSRHYGIKRQCDLNNDEQYATLKPALSLVGYKKVYQGDLAMNIMRARNGSFGISAYDGIVSPAYCVYQIKQKCNLHYLHYLLKSPQMIRVFESNSKGIAEHRRRLYADTFLQLYSILPPADEQDSIVALIERQSEEAQKVVSVFEKQIRTLTDLRARIISDVVTGQINVRNIEIPNFEYEEDIISVVADAQDFDVEE